MKNNVFGYIVICLSALLLVASPVRAVDCQVKAIPFLHTDSYTMLIPHGSFGGSDRYHTTIRNDDSYDCGMGYLTVTVSAPDGWNTSVDPSTPIQIKPGDTGSFTTYVRPPQQTTKGTYELPVRITNTTTGLSTDTKYWYIVTDDPPAKPTPTSTPRPTARPTARPTTKPTMAPVILVSVTPTPIDTNKTLPVRGTDMQEAGSQPLYIRIWTRVSEFFRTLFIR